MPCRSAVLARRVCLAPVAYCAGLGLPRWSAVLVNTSQWFTYNEQAGGEAEERGRTSNEAGRR